MKKNKKLKKKLNQGGVNGEYQQSQEQGNALASGVGSINPLIGGFMKAGMAIGKQTMDENGLYTSKAGQFLDNSINPATGIQNLKDVLKKPTMSNVANQLSLGLIGKGATQKKREAAVEKQQHKIAMDYRMQNQQEQTMPTFKNGGKLSAGDVVGGGSLDPISKDAVQVKATDPSKTDSVELQTAFVDHNEVIDKKDRVYSDAIKTPTGRTVAKEAARLEKMKNNAGRFKPSNDRIDSKLDELFKYQEQTKQDATRVDMKQPLSADQLKMNGEYGVLDALRGHRDDYDRKLDKKIANLKSQQPMPATTKKTLEAKPGFFTGGDPNDPNALKALAKSQSYEGPEYTPLNPNTTFEQNSFKVQNNLAKALEFKNNLSVGQKATKVYYDPLSGSQQNRPVTPDMVAAADSTIAASRQWQKEAALRASLAGTKPGFSKGGKKPKLAFGGPDPEMESGVMQSPFQAKGIDTSPLKQMSIGQPNFKQIPLTKTTESSTQKNPFDWKGVGTAAAQFAPDMANIFAVSKMSGPKAPTRENAMFLNKMSADAGLAENARQTSNMNRAIQKTTAQASTALGNMGSVLAKRFAADNQVRQGINNQNAQIANQEAAMNVGIKARNVAGENQFKADQVAAKNAKLSAYSQIGANVGQKAMQMKAEQGRKEYDRMYLDVLRQKYKDSGMNERFVNTIMKKYEDEAYKNPKGAFKYGGKMPKRKKC